VGLVPVVYILLGLVLGVAVALLDSSLKLLTLAVNNGQVVIGELAPLLLDLTLHVLPVSFNAIPIHR
jgi:hypothetical protein